MGETPDKKIIEDRRISGLLKVVGEDHVHPASVVKRSAFIVRDRLYQISSFLYPMELPLEDERFLYFGNKNVLLSGQGLLELSKEMEFIYVSDRPFCGNTFADAKKILKTFIEGQAYWEIKDSNIDYNDALARIEKEEKRCKDLNQNHPLG